MVDDTQGKMYLDIFTGNLREMSLDGMITQYKFLLTKCHLTTLLRQYSLSRNTRKREKCWSRSLISVLVDSYTKDVVVVSYIAH